MVREWPLKPSILVRAQGGHPTNKDTIEWRKIVYDNFENLRNEIQYIQFRRTT